MNKRSLWRPLEDESIRDPWRMYSEIRETEPVHLSQTGEYIITRYDDVKQVLKSELFDSGNRLTWLKKSIAYFDNKEEDLRAIHQAMNSFILMLNGEHHQRIRNFVARTWTSRDVDPIIRANISRLLDSLREEDIDFVAEYAQPLPVLTISGILGISLPDTRYLNDLGIAMTKALDLYISLKDLVQINRAATEFVSFFREQIARKRDHPDDGLLSKMILRNHAEGYGLTDEELISIAIFLFTAGEETSSSLISSAMLSLLQHPDQLALLRSQPELIEPAIEEVLRYHGIVHLLGRISRETVSLHDKTIPKGSAITLVVASANRDGRVFEDPDRFIISRKPNRHLSFGSGRHFCLGDWLARRQSQMAIAAFLDRFPTIALRQQELSWARNLAIRRLNALTVRGEFGC